MKKFKSPVLIALVCLSLFVWDAWRYAPKPLCFGLQSGMSQGQLASFLIEEKVEPDDVKTETKGEATGAYQSMTIENFAYGAVEGELYLEFYEDELCAVSYYPDDYELFARQMLGRHLKRGEIFEVQEGGVSRMNAEWHSTEGITWRDNARYGDLVEYVLAST